MFKISEKYNFKSKQDVKKWIMLNHPDKNQNKTHPDLQTILSCYTNEKFNYDKDNNTSTKSNTKPKILKK